MEFVAAWKCLPLATTAKGSETSSIRNFVAFPTVLSARVNSAIERTFEDHTGGICMVVAVQSMIWCPVLEEWRLDLLRGYARAESEIKV